MGRTPHYRRTPPTLKRAQAEAPDQATQLVRGFFARATSQRVLHYKHKNNQAPPETRSTRAPGGASLHPQIPHSHTKRWQTTSKYATVVTEARNKHHQREQQWAHGTTSRLPTSTRATSRSPTPSPTTTAFARGAATRRPPHSRWQTPMTSPTPPSFSTPETTAALSACTSSAASTR